MPFSLKMRSRVFDFESNRFIAVLHEDDAKNLGIQPLDRIEILNPKPKKRAVGVVDITKHEVRKGEIGLFKELRKELLIRKQVIVEVTPVPCIESNNSIIKKIKGNRLSEDEIRQIVLDIDANMLSEIEIAAFMTSVFINGFSTEETVSMAKALIDNGKRLHLNKEPILDKHCVGGTNGRSTLIIVPIIAAAGFYIPKTSSRAITSAAGTADCMETLCPVSFSLERIKRIIEKTNACIVWGGALDLAPVDDKIIKIEHPLALDPEGQVVASVMAKKASVGSKFVVIDIPVGRHSKVSDKEKAVRIAEKFIKVGKELGIRVEVLLSDGSEPSGPAFGPALEARHALQILEGKVFDNLAQKSCELAGSLLEMVGFAKKTIGVEIAKEFLNDGRALEKFWEIATMQGGKRVNSENLRIGAFSKKVFSKSEGIIKSINSRIIVRIAREAGAPSDKGAGVLLKAMPGDKVKAGQLLFEIYSDNQRKLEAAKSMAEKSQAIELEKVIIGRFF